MSSNASDVDDDTPQSIEEAGALLGAAITRYSSPGSHSTINPPQGTHSSFATITPVPSSELMVLLHSLRSLLRSAPTDTPLVAAPSLLAGVLLKLLSISSSLASAPIVDPSRRVGTPPMLSSPLRKLWVDCVVLCHTLGEGLSGNARINIYGFVRNMIALAGMNPRTARAAGGTRTAALEVIGGLMEEEKLSKQLASWSLDIIDLSKRALRSIGNGEPTYRIAAVQTACSAAVASRCAFMSTRPMEGTSRLLLKGALEDKAILEMVKLLKIAVADRTPEIRAASATLVSLLAPLVIHISIKSPSTPDAVAASPTASLEDIMTIAFRNLDDESPYVAAAWAEALARCMSTSIEYHKQKNDERASQRNADGGAPTSGGGGGGGGPNSSRKNTDPKGGSGRGIGGMRKGVLSTSSCSTLPKALRYLVGVFVNAGGELMAPRAGGSFSTGGRAVRIGFTKAMIELLRIQTTMQCVGEGRSISHKEAVLIALSLVGGEMDNQLSANDRGASTPKANLDATSVVTASSARQTSISGANMVSGLQGAFGQGPKISDADAGMARLASSRVLREGISKISPEVTQISILHELIQLCVNKIGSLKPNQLQVIMIEVSHLLSTLGEAAASALDDLSPVFQKTLRHPDHGVRHETAVACVAMASIFPSQGSKLVLESLNSIQIEHAELMKLASTTKASDVSDSNHQTAPRFRFRRQAPVLEVKVDESLKHQYAIHGMALAVSMLIRDLPTLPGGLPVETLDMAISVSEILTSSLFNDVMTNGNPSAACTSVRAGFGIISSVVTTGPDAIVKHVALIFGVWQKANKQVVGQKQQQRGKKLTSDHELICIESMLVSIVSFLKNCSELLLSIPDALSRTSLILEELLPLFFGNGKLGRPPENPAASSRLDSAKASILESFSWLPPGSYPMVAETVFNFAAGHIQWAIQNNVTCSLIHSIVSKEDSILDSVSMARAKIPGQVGDAEELENDIIALRSVATHHVERESAFIFFRPNYDKGDGKREEFHGSEALRIIADDHEEEKPPTVLHEVGTWRRPAVASCSAKIRLVDAAVHTFAATFSLKSGREQQSAMEMLESLIPPVQMQTNFQGVRTSITEQDRRNRQSKDVDTCLENVTAAVLSCLRALPIQESTHNVPIGLGPTWMNKAKDVLLSVFHSPSAVVRRGAAEGLSFLATLGVKEDAHFLQSAVLHSLDEIIQGKDSQSEGRPVSIESLSTARASALLALACIQRTSDRIQKIRAARSRLRGSSITSKEEGKEDMVQLSQIMIRVLPSIAFHPTGGFFGARTYGLHAFGLLMSYKNDTGGGNLDEQDSHLLRKTVELVEDNFLSAWNAASSSFDQGNEAEKLSLEAPFLAVLLRLMTILLPSLHHLESIDPRIASRFSKMASIIMECGGSHPLVHTEGMAFWEMLTKHQQLLPPHTGGVKYEEHPILCSIPFLMSNLTPRTSPVHQLGIIKRSHICPFSVPCVRSSLVMVNTMSKSQVLIAEWTDMKAVALLFARLEATTGSRCFNGDVVHRNISAPRASEVVYDSNDSTDGEIVSTIRSLPFLERKSSRKCLQTLLRYVLLSRSLVIGTSSAGNNDDDNDTPEYTISAVVAAAISKSATDAFPVLEYSNSVRWQTKTIAIHTATIAITEMVEQCKQDGLQAYSSYFDPLVARSECLKECSKAATSKSSLPESRFALHAEAVLTAACVTSTATVDQAELRGLQESAVHMLIELLNCFEKIADPDQKAVTLLNEYIPQITSCIKNALAAADDLADGSSCRLFLSGCHALEAFVRTKVTDEAAVLKRVIRPVLPSPDEVSFFSYDSSQETRGVTKGDGDPRSSLLVKIGRIWSLGSLWPGHSEVIDLILEAGKDEIGVNAAALAIDGSNLLLCSSLSLIGSRSDSSDDLSHIADCGFFYNHVGDLDLSVKSALAKSWAACASLGITFLCETILAQDTMSETKDACLVWLERITPLCFAGLNDAIVVLSDPSNYKNLPNWAAGIDCNEVACQCLQGICVIVSKPEILEAEEKWQKEIQNTMALLSDLVLTPALSTDESRSRPMKVELVEMACSFLAAFSNNPSMADDSESTLLLSLLRPLDHLQRGSVALSNESAAMVASACLNAVTGLIAKPDTTKPLVDAMIALILSLSSKDDVPDVVKNAIRSLLECCLKFPGIGVKEKSSIATALAKVEDWEAWAAVARLDEGAAAGQSLKVIQAILLDSNRPEQQLVIISHLASLLQAVPPPNPLAGRIVYSIGAEIFSVFQAYGTQNVLKRIQSERSKVCANCMKISLVAYQQFVSDVGEEEVNGFLVTMFETLIKILRYNGLPNHPPPQAGSDPAIGRMCAQAILHVARTTASAFKACVASMAEHDRAVLEFAIRAEMSGYATAASAPVKKKLNLKSFKT